MPQQKSSRAAAAKKNAGKKNLPVSKPEEIIQTSFRLPRSRWTKLQTLVVEERASVQSIIVSALEAEFAKRGRSF